jgi:hypothetical protein
MRSAILAGKLVCYTTMVDIKQTGTIHSVLSVFDSSHGQSPLRNSMHHPINPVNQLFNLFLVNSPNPPKPLGNFLFWTLAN